MKKYVFMEVCECGEPTRTFDICSYLGYNPGTDGHMFDQVAVATVVWNSFLVALTKDRMEGKVRGDYWTELPFSSIEEEISYLGDSVKLVAVQVGEVMDMA